LCYSFFFRIYCQISVLIIDSFLQFVKCIYGEFLCLTTSIQANNNQTSIPHNYDKRPTLMEKNSSTRVYEVFVCFLLLWWLIPFYSLENTRCLFIGMTIQHLPCLFLLSYVLCCSFSFWIWFFFLLVYQLLILFYSMVSAILANC